LRRGWRPLGGVYVAALAVVVAASVAIAAIFYIMDMRGRVSAIARPLIWYGSPVVPPSGLAVSVSPLGDSAYVGSAGGLALALRDLNGTVAALYRVGMSRVAFRSYINVSAEATVVNASLPVDPANSGLVLLHTRALVARVTFFSIESDWYWGRLVYYRNGSVAAVLAYRYIVTNQTGTYIINESSHNCSLGVLPPAPGLRVNVTVLMNPATGEANVTARMGGRVVCTALFPIDIPVLRVNYGSVNVFTGSTSPAAEYTVVLDDYRFLLENRTARALLTEDFDDGVYTLPRLTVYNGTDYVAPPADGTAAVYLVPAGGGRAVETYTTLPGGTEALLGVNDTDGSCSIAYGGRIRPIHLVERTGSNYTDLPVKIVLNASNFGDWSLVSPDGSDIYFTGPYGAPLRYWIESIDTVAQEAVIYVEVPSLPAYGETTIYMHYGGVNPYASYNVGPGLVVEFEDQLNYTSLTDLLASGNWVVVNQSAIMDVNVSGVYTYNGNHTFVMRTSRSFTPPFVLRFDLAACYNVSSDWDSGVAIGWDNTTNYVVYLDDIGGVTGFIGTFMAIAEGIDSPQWSNADYIAWPRLDGDYTAYHTYEVAVLPDGDRFKDLSDGRVNDDDVYALRAIVLNYGNISGYVWIVNDGDTGDNCAIYRRVEVLRGLPDDLAPLVIVEPPVAPRIQLWATNASEATWPVYALLGPQHLAISPPGLYTVNASAAGGNLTVYHVYAQAPPVSSCGLEVPAVYGVTGDFSLSVVLPVRIEYSTG